MTASGNSTLAGISGRGYGSFTERGAGTPEEQLLLVWQKLSTFQSSLVKLEDDIKRQGGDFDKKLHALRGEALAFSKDAEQRLAKSLTSAPLMAVVGLWLILLGSLMQLYLALP